MGAHPFLVSSFLGCVILWVALVGYVVAVQRQRVKARAIVVAAMDALHDPQVRTLPLSKRVARIRPWLNRASRSLVMHVAADPTTPPHAFEALAAHLQERWTADALIRDASAHRTAREKWRRSVALRILFQLDHPRAIELLERAVAGSDTAIAAVALSLLGQSRDPRAVDVMLHALRVRRHPASRIAVYLDRSPQQISDRLLALLDDHDPTLRFWAATLLGRYTEVDGLERALLPLANDRDPRVRKAVVESLGKVGESQAAATARRLLQDPVPYVRATAARTLGVLALPDLASDVALLLGDVDWWVRRAAKDALEAMGPDVWPVLVRCLDDPDEFVRNGAAEVFQNLGVLDSLIVMEAASDNPSMSKIDMLRRITAAGGVRLTESLLDRCGDAIGPRVRRLLQTIGLQQVEAC